MPSTTASEIQLKMNSVAKQMQSAQQTLNQQLSKTVGGVIIIDEWSYDGPRPLQRSDFVMVRCGIGRKDYGFKRARVDEWPAGKLVKRYACSHLEAERRFTIWLVKQRLTS